jgi:hypothetical protein
MIFDIGLGGGRKVRILVRGFGGMILWDRIMILMGGGVGHYTLALLLVHIIPLMESCLS